MKTTVLTPREKAIKMINGWNPQERTEWLAFYRRKGYLCNDEEEIIAATIEKFYSTASGAKAIVGLIQFIVAIAMILFGVSMCSCSSTPEQQLISKVDKYMSTEFVKNLKDPSSFQKVSCMVFDTMTVEKYKAKYNKDAGSEFKNGILHIKLSYTYRAKNGFGALDMYETTVRYYPNTDKFSN